jgi:hypothetical protein
MSGDWQFHRPAIDPSTTRSSHSNMQVSLRDKSVVRDLAQDVGVGPSVFQSKK